MEPSLIPDESVISKIYLIRGVKVMLDADLAALYQGETKYLKRQVRRNAERFPQDFMFELTVDENKLLRCQFGTLEQGKYNKYLPMAFTEQGVAMLSNVLNSKEAIRVNIQIIRIFTRLRQLLQDNTEIRLEIEKMQKKIENHGKSIELLFTYLDELLEKKQSPETRKQIGFRKE